MIEYDHLINKKKIEENDQVENLLNPTSKIETKFLCDPYIAQLQ